MRISRFVAPFFAAAVALPALSLSASASLLIQVDKSTQTMTVSEDGQPLYVWPVSTGRRGFDTPNGAFTPFRMDKDHRSKEWDNAPMPNSIFFTTSGDAIHGTYEESYLGHAVSHGCVRLSRRHAAILWDLVKDEKMANTKVVLTGHIPNAGPPLVAKSVPPTDDDVTTSVAERQYRPARSWQSEPYSYDGRQAYYGDEPPPPPPRYVRRYRGIDNGFDDQDRGPPFPFSLFSQ
jgi:hypothetical protein